MNTTYLQDWDGAIHVYPLNDLREHETKAADCWCTPNVDIDEYGSVLIVHNSLDGREKFETGERKPS